MPSKIAAIEPIINKTTEKKKSFFFFLKIILIAGVLRNFLKDLNNKLPMIIKTIYEFI
jgi:hypothetical protein